MKKLVVISALLLFSVDVFAQEEVCYVTGDQVNKIANSIEENCKKGQLLWASINDGDRPITEANWLTSAFCDFNREILVLENESGRTTVQCVIAVDEPRVTGGAYKADF